MRVIIAVLLVLGLAAGCGHKPPAGKWITLRSGLRYRDIAAGTGAQAAVNSRVTVNYRGWLDNGKVFDSSRKPGAGPLSFTIGATDIIKGWSEGIAGMKVGGTRELTVPPALGYADEEMGPIPANSTLHFQIELIDVR
jgi:FKBP-type peptidyl-prolyl cis-trans isomerase FkpA